MKILFVCKGNIARSQIAEALSKKYYDFNSISAGTKLSNPELGEMIKNIPLTENLFIVMNEEGIDFSDKKRKEVTKEMINDVDKIIIMAEEETIPEFLKNNKKVIYWKIEDPRGKSLEEWRKLVKQLKELLKTLNKQKFSKNFHSLKTAKSI